MTADHGDDLDEHRRRQLRRLFVIGAALGVTGGVVVAVLGADGATSLTVMLVGLAAALGVTSLVGVLTALIDEWRGHRVGRRRMLVALGQLAAVPLCFVLAAGASGGAG